MPSIAGFATRLDRLTADTAWKQYLLVTTSVVLALLLRELLVLIFGINLFALLFLPPVIIAGLAFGLVPGIFAAALATFVAYVPLHSNFNQFFPSSADMLLNGIVIACVNLFVAVVGASHWNNRKRLEAALDELNHRTKNLITVINGIVRHLARNTNDIDLFRDAVDKRLRSMAAAHDLLVKNEWKDTTLSSVVDLAIAPFMNGDQITVHGPDILVPSIMVENLMMALNELLTNSAKYGALTSPTGQIKISWKVGGGRFRFIWDGLDKLHHKPVSHKGFGTIVLTNIVPRNLHGQATYQINKGHVLWTLDVPFGSPAKMPGVTRPHVLSKAS
jgi:two-component sensor histidine kinase